MTQCFLGAAEGTIQWVIYERLKRYQADRRQLANTKNQMPTSPSMFLFGSFRNLDMFRLD